MSLGMLWACIFMFQSPAPGVPCVSQGKSGALGGSTMAGTPVSLGMLGASPLASRADALVLWEANCDMPGTKRLVGLRLYNKKVAFRGFGGGPSNFTLASSHNHHFS